MNDLKAIYKLIVRCLETGGMSKTVERLQGQLNDLVKKGNYECI